jgi:solute carrier family 35 (UDP-xylose/UDP-N-acetylglucosamine transporter), member B4
VNNYAFAFDISQPVHMVFRSSSLLSTVGLGYFMFGHRYSVQRLVAVAMAFAGVFTVTLAEARMKQLAQCPSCDHQGWWPIGEPATASTTRGDGDGDKSVLVWFMGISLLFGALFLSSYLGHLQQKTYQEHGKDWREGLLWQHGLSLPYFFFLLPDITAHFAIAADSELWSLFGVASVPSMLVVLVGNLLTQLVCILGVYQLTAVAGTLECTFTLTCRKLLSLILSIWWFQNPFSYAHWFGTAAVFVGATMFSLDGKVNFLPFLQQAAGEEKKGKQQ